MPIVILIMQRKAIVQALMTKLGGNPGIRLIFEPNYSKAPVVIHNQAAKVALIEVAESGRYDMLYCLTLCKQLRKAAPDCKLLLMCPEQNEGSVKLVINAKCGKQIDDFVFYDVTIDYLASKMLSL